MNFAVFLRDIFCFVNLISNALGDDITNWLPTILSAVLRGVINEYKKVIKNLSGKFAYNKF